VEGINPEGSLCPVTHTVVVVVVVVVVVGVVVVVVVVVERKLRLFVDCAVLLVALPNEVEGRQTV
jgi:hypothetical protein